MADAPDSKSGIREDVWVRPPPPAPSNNLTSFRRVATTVSGKNHGLFCGRGQGSSRRLSRREPAFLEASLFRRTSRINGVAVALNQEPRNIDFAAAICIAGKEVKEILARICYVSGGNYRGTKLLHWAKFKASLPKSTTAGTPVFLRTKLTVLFCQPPFSLFRLAMSPWLAPKCQ